MGQDPRDGLVRADQIVGVHARRTPAISGKPSHWLLNAVLPLTTGGGQLDTWATSPLHRTLIQTSNEPHDAPEHLARLLAQLDAAGTITAAISDLTARVPAADNATHSRGSGPAPAPATTTTVRFQFAPFRGTDPGHRYDPDYL